MGGCWRGGGCFIGATHQLWQELLRVCGYCGSSGGRWCSGGFLQEEWGVVEGILGLNEVLRFLRPAYLSPKEDQKKLPRFIQDGSNERVAVCTT